MFAVLGLIAGETQSLVGHELAGARVDSSADGNTKDNTEGNQFRGNSLQGPQTLRDGVSALVLLRKRESKRPRGLHPQRTSRVHGDGESDAWWKE